MEKSKLIAAEVGGMKNPVHRTEKVLLETPGTGEAPFQSKSTA